MAENTIKKGKKNSHKPPWIAQVRISTPMSTALFKSIMKSAIIITKTQKKSQKPHKKHI
jgi:hypothetical protein